MNKQSTDAWNYSISSGCRNAFWLMEEQGDLADVFDLVFSELTKEQIDNINQLIDAEIWKKLHVGANNK
tara:strand:- start:1417 stop:1623 length:207 start_codon:yes stop_codon:yes gene_type:complete